MKKAGSAETPHGREMYCGHCGGEGAMVMENGERQTTPQGSTQGKTIPVATGLENKRAQIF